MGWYVAAVGAAAPSTPLCVGFNTWEDLLPVLYAAPSAGGAPPLAFDCHHAYADTPFGYSNATVISWVPTVLDRLYAGSVALGTPRPIMLGETGSSNGEFVAGPAAGGALLDVHSAAAFDALPALLSLAHGHAGTLRWQVRAGPPLAACRLAPTPFVGVQVEDVPYVFSVLGQPWLGNHSDPSNTYGYVSQA